MGMDRYLEESHRRTSYDPRVSDLQVEVEVIKAVMHARIEAVEARNVQAQAEIDVLTAGLEKVLTTFEKRVSTLEGYFQQPM
jgi:hypothetical protein